MPRLHGVPQRDKERRRDLRRRLRAAVAAGDEGSPAMTWTWAKRMAVCLGLVIVGGWADRHGWVDLGHIAFAFFA